MYEIVKGKFILTGIFNADDVTLMTMWWHQCHINLDCSGRVGGRWDETYHSDVGSKAHRWIRARTTAPAACRGQAKTKPVRHTEHAECKIFHWAGNQPLELPFQLGNRWQSSRQRMEALSTWDFLLSVSSEACLLVKGKKFHSGQHHVSHLFKRVGNASILVKHCLIRLSTWFGAFWYFYVHKHTLIINMFNHNYRNPLQQAEK